MVAGAGCGELQLTADTCQAVVFTTLQPTNIFCLLSNILQLHRRGHCWRSQKITFEIAGEGGAVDMISLDNLKFQTWVIDS